MNAFAHAARVGMAASLLGTIITVRANAMPESISQTSWLDAVSTPSPQVPFSFAFGGKPGADLVASWPSKRSVRHTESAKTTTSTAWTDPASGLRVTWEVTRFSDYPAVDWVLYFENTGKADSPIIENVQALDTRLDSPLPGDSAYLLHRTNGAPADPTDYEPSVVAFKPGHSETLGGGGGRSSNRDFPFIKVEAGDGSRIIAIGWSGQWEAKLTEEADNSLHISSGLELTHFKLHPGERVRSPRIVVIYTTGDTLECNALFRELVQAHYVAKRSGKTPQPTLFCNTCFTRGGGWLNECNAANQISLINAYAPLGLEALITDAGWFEGGWPDGAGNWTPRKDAYPDGMRPVAAAAKAKGLIYGLWFEPERVVRGTGLYKSHPDWILNDGSADQQWFLADFGRKEVQDYFFDIVKGFMELPGFRFYRQDFNMDPLPNWRHADAPDRQGITEMKYVTGLYAYWDRIAKAWPDSIREDCASGGRRIDIETIQRMHLHQASDYWWDDDVNQARAWGFGQYLPNGIITEPVNNLNEYSVYSAMTASLCLGWIADAADFDAATAKKYTDLYKSVRPLLTGAWYPLLPYSRKPDSWMASQYHRRDSNEGFVLAFRHAESKTDNATVALHGLDPNARYELTGDTPQERVTGKALMEGLAIRITAIPGCALIKYRRVTR